MAQSRSAQGDVTSRGPEERSRDTPWTLGDVAVVLAVTLIAGNGWYDVSHSALGRAGWQALLTVVVPAGLVYVVILAVLLGLVHRRAASRDDLGLRLCSVEWAVYALPAAGVVLGLSGAAAAGVQALISVPVRQCDVFRALWTASAPGAIVVLAMLAPATEEIVFRGVVFGWLRARIGVIAATLTVSVVFGAVHLAGYGPAVAAGTAAESLALCAVYVWSRSLVPGMLTHGLANLYVLVHFAHAQC